jgi:hypothetical protein
MRVFNRHISTRGLTLFAFETVLVSGTIMAAGHFSGSLETVAGAAWKVVLVTMPVSCASTTTTLRPHA